MAYEPIACPHCDSESVVKNGKTANQKQNYLCKGCRKQFIRDYTDNGSDQKTKELIIPMTLNSSGIRDISRVLKLSPNTVLKTIREEADKRPDQVQRPCVVEAVEIDEQWSFVAIVP